MNKDKILSIVAFVVVFCLLRPVVGKVFDWIFKREAEDEAI